MPRDPRWFQIATLSGLTAYGAANVAFAPGPLRIALTLAAALAAQALATRLWRLPRFDPKSALISGLSLCVLLRADALWIPPAAAAFAILSKFLIRARGKHVFNPTNGAIAAALLLSDRAWVSPGQWGHAAFLAAALLFAGGWVVFRAGRSETTLWFLGAWTALLAGRALWLGDPLAIPLHRLQSGALLIFAFLMISDPKTTPDSPAGRRLFAVTVALLAFGWQHLLYRNDGPLWALAALSPFTPWIDRLLPGRRYRWNDAGAAPAPTAAVRPIPRPERRLPMPRPTFPLALAAALLTAAAPAAAFCGFYVARADAELFNRASRVALVRHGDRTVLTMESDYRGDPAEFAMVVPVPTFLEREQIRVAERALLDRLDAFTAPRLVEYFDDDPCAMAYRREMAKSAFPEAARADADREAARALGVTIEARYAVGEYDILILSAEESAGLSTWLTANGYRIPAGAERVLSSYIRQGQRFFVAKVDLAEQARLGYSTLRPLQIAFESPRFGLPIRLGTVNADGDQDLIVFALTKQGRVETTNYRTVRIPSGEQLPRFVREEFSEVYPDLFAEQVRRENGRAVFLEYAWNMAWCDPCAADPLSRDELRELGVFWLGGDDARGGRRPAPGGAQQAFVTRLHLRYNGTTFPEDLVFQETGDTSKFQGRYVLRHPWSGDGRVGGERGGPATCPAAEAYRDGLPARFEQEARTLARLTGRDVADVRDRMRADGQDPDRGPLGPDGEPVADPRPEEPWWRRIWGGAS